MGHHDYNKLSQASIESIGPLLYSRCFQGENAYTPITGMQLNPELLASLLSNSFLLEGISDQCLESC